MHFIVVIFYLVVCCCGVRRGDSCGKCKMEIVNISHVALKRTFLMYGRHKFRSVALYLIISALLYKLFLI